MEYVGWRKGGKKNEWKEVRRKEGLKRFVWWEFGGGRWIIRWFIRRWKGLKKEER
jgi:hypothetical protein